jgi:rod shape-determining protein MreD
MKAAVVFVALALALLLQSTLGGISLTAGTKVNFILVAVIYCALSFGAMTGLLAGLAGGLAQDAIAGGILGVGGISKTLVGFLVGVLGAQFIVSQPLTRFVMFFGASLLHELCFQSLSAVVEARDLRFHYSAVFTHAAVNAMVGILAFQVVEKTPGLLQRRDARRASFGSRRQF